MAKGKRWLAKKNLKTASFDLPVELIAELNGIAEEYGISKSQLISALAYMSLKDIKRGKLDNYLTNSRSPAFRYNLDLERIKKDYD